ncbi:MAG: HlyC/CorC family transporter [Ferruginibacter sp.]|uniref:hemolysin family protein n=1 Tax=Ferruginibacter sp. TaxID=1940288 RepID=UPI002659F1A7|nr:hemolysin family protein [Ferruginibacter sp.]MDB5277353.1 HlyC/CorC family transporter [Ferruginibacter sp.]
MEILIIFFLIILNGIFSMSEIALVSSRKFKLEAAAKRGNKNAKKALELAGNPNTFLSTVQIGITLIGILTGIYSGEQITEDVKSIIIKVSFLTEYAHSVSVVIVLIILTFFSIVFGELIPKRIGLMFPETIAMLVARPMTYISIITKPFIWLLTKTNDLFLSIFGLKGKKDGIVSEEEIKAIVQESAEGGEIREIEQDIVHRVFALGDRKVSELMTHRSDLVYFDITDDLATIKQRAEMEPHSIYPVVNKSLDKTLGIVSVKDIFPKNFKDAAFNLQQFLKQPAMVHGNTPAYKILEQFRESKLHYAFVIDEYGIVEGLVSMDDILDALVGDATEYNQDEYGIVQRDENSWLADGQYPFFEFLNYFDLAEEKIKGDYNTIGGLILAELNHIPAAGEKVKWYKFNFEIMDMDGQRIDKILVSIK